jgi:hypothetical protein
MEENAVKVSDKLTESNHKDVVMVYHLFCIEHLYNSVILHQSGSAKLSNSDLIQSVSAAQSMTDHKT